MSFMQLLPKRSVTLAYVNGVKLAEFKISEISEITAANRRQSQRCVFGHVTVGTSGISGISGVSETDTRHSLPSDSE